MSARDIIRFYGVIKDKFMNSDRSANMIEDFSTRCSLGINGLDEDFVRHLAARQQLLVDCLDNIAFRDGIAKLHNNQNHNGA